MSIHNTVIKLNALIDKMQHEGLWLLYKGLEKDPSQVKPSPIKKTPFASKRNKEATPNEKYATPFAATM